MPRASLTSRALQYAVTAWLVLTLNFALPRLMPGNPLAELDNPQGLPMPLSEEQRQRLLAYYELDRPLHEQYAGYLEGLARGDLGWSILYNAPVGRALAGRLGWTLGLVGVATVLYVLVGVALGCISAWHRGRWGDGLLLTLGAVLEALPPFFVGMLLILLFAVRLRWLPMGGARSAVLPSTDALARWLDVGRHMVLPVVALALTNIGQVYYLTRNAAVQTLGEGYITVARSKGLMERLVLFRHALPNALLPVVHLVALRFGYVVMGAVMIEAVFAYPGVGSAIVEAGVGRDYPLLQGAFAIVMVSILGANLLAEALQGYLDPRLRHA